MLDNIQILADTQETAELMQKQAVDRGVNVVGSTLWSGPIPPLGSFEEIDEYTRMSTAEFFFLRKANELQFDDAVAVGNELCGYYRTKRTAHNMPADTVDILDDPRTHRVFLFAYLMQIANTREGQRALEVLDHVKDCTRYKK